MKKVESYEQACEIEGLDPAATPDLSMLPAYLQKSTMSFIRLVIIVRAINKLANDGNVWIPDFEDLTQKKWQPMFCLKKDKSNPSGFRFVFSCYVNVSSAAPSGSRLCFKNESDSDYAGVQFQSDYRNLLSNYDGNA